MHRCGGHRGGTGGAAPGSVSRRGRPSQDLFREELWDLHIRKTFFEQAVFEGLLYIVFAVDDEDGLYFLGVLAGEELQEVNIVAVGAHAADAADFGMDLVKDAEDVYFLCA